MKIRFSPYQLEGRGGFPSRQGALLEWAFEDQTIGYADCHPWETLGDAALDKQLSLLRQGRLTPLTSRSLDFAMIDAQARADKRHLLADLIVPRSHCLVTSLEMPKGFTVYKCKDPKLSLEILPRLEQGKQLRVDFNFKLTEAQAIAFAERANPYTDKLDYIEDPFPFDAQRWQAFERTYGVALALDRSSDGQEYPLRIVKPAVTPPLKAGCRDRLVYTSYLDHPLGQVAAAYAAAKAGCKEVCGLASHLVYRENAFSRQFSLVDSRLKTALDGYGFGFDSCLKELKWQPL